MRFTYLHWADNSMTANYLSTYVRLQLFLPERVIFVQLLQPEICFPLQNLPDVQEI